MNAAETRNRIRQLLDREGPVILDGGLATQLETMGFDIGGELWSAALLADKFSKLSLIMGYDGNWRK